MSMADGRGVKSPAPSTQPSVIGWKWRRKAERKKTEKKREGWEEWRRRRKDEKENWESLILYIVMGLCLQTIIVYMQISNRGFELSSILRYRNSMIGTGLKSIFVGRELGMFFFYLRLVHHGWNYEIWPESIVHVNTIFINFILD